MWSDLVEHGRVVSAVESGLAPILVDHLGNVAAPAAVDDPDPGVALLRDLLGAGNCWVTLSGAYRLAPGRAEAAAARLSQRRVDAVLGIAPDRVVWGPTGRTWRRRGHFRP